MFASARTILQSLPKKLLISFNNMPFWESSDLDFSNESLNPTPIVVTQLNAFVKQDFLILQNAVSPQAVDNQVATLKSQLQDKAYDTWRRVQNAWQEIPLVKQIACDEKILALLEIFYRSRSISFQTLSFCLDSEQKTQGDRIHFSAKPERFMCGVWVALENIDENNGPLVYYSESHKLPIVSNDEQIAIRCLF